MLSGPCPHMQGRPRLRSKLGLKRLPRAISKLFLRVTHVSPYTSSHIHTQQVEPSFGGLLIPMVWLGSSQSKTRLCQLQAAEDRGWLARLEVTSRDVPLMDNQEGRAKDPGVCMLWKTLGVCYHATSLRIASAPWRLGWAGLVIVWLEASRGKSFCKERVFTRWCSFLSHHRDRPLFLNLGTSKWSIYRITPSCRLGRQMKMYFQCPCPYVPYPVGAT